MVVCITTKHIEVFCMNFLVKAVVKHVIIITITNYMNSKFHSTFITLVIKTVHDVYFIVYQMI